MKLFKRILFKLFFLSTFISITYYIYFIKTEKYESKSIIMIKDISGGQSMSPLGTLLSVGSSKSMQDAKLLEVYIQSAEMYNLVNKEFDLSSYYSSSQIDILHRLSDGVKIFKFKIPFLGINKRNLLSKYSDDLSIVYDDSSATLNISFAHADAKIAQKIVNSIIRHSAKTLNLFEKKSSEIILSYLKKLEIEKYTLFISSMQDLLRYQNQHKTFDPKIDIELKSSILSNLESQVIQKEVEYQSKLQYMNPHSTEMQLHENTIENIRNNIEKIKNEISGSLDNEELNVNVSDFELLKSKMEFNKEIYRQILVKLEETNILVNQNTKNLIVVAKPEIADSYSSPNKIKDTFSIFIILFFLYGIFSMIFKLIQDHKD